MKRIFFFANLLWLLFSLITCIESFRLKLGEIHKPGPGFFPFSVGLVMLGLSLAALFQSMGKKEEIRKGVRQEPLRWWNIVIMGMLAGTFFSYLRNFPPNRFTAKPQNTSKRM